jgi:hypothetical protein
MKKNWNWVFNSLGGEAEKQVAQLGSEEKLHNSDSPKETAIKFVR